MTLRALLPLPPLPGLDYCSVATIIESDVPVRAERSVYYNDQGIKGGHASIGAAETKENLYFAEGYTGT